MSNELKASSEIKQVKFYLIGLLGIIGSGTYSFFLYRLAFMGPYPDLIGLIFATIVLSFTTFSVFTILKLARICVYDDRIIVKPIFGFKKTIIYRNDIISWIEVEKKGKSNVWHVLSVFTAKNSYKFSSATFKNYTKLKTEITRGIFHDEEKEFRIQPTNGKAVCFIPIIIGLASFYFAFVSYPKNDENLRYSDLTTIKEIVTSEINTIKVRSEFIKLKLKDYPEFVFDISGDAYSATMVHDFENTVHTGDTILVDIKTEDYKKKLTKEEEMTFFDKTVGYDYIEVLGLRYKDDIYLTLDNYNRIKNKTGYLMFLIMGYLFTGYGLFFYFFFFRKTKAQV